MKKEWIPGAVFSLDLNREAILRENMALAQEQVRPDHRGVCHLDAFLRPEQPGRPDPDEVRDQPPGGGPGVLHGTDPDRLGPPARTHHRPGQPGEICA